MKTKEKQCRRQLSRCIAVKLMHAEDPLSAFLSLFTEDLASYGAAKSCTRGRPVSMPYGRSYTRGRKAG